VGRKAAAEGYRTGLRGTAAALQERIELGDAFLAGCGNAGACDSEQDPPGNLCRFFRNLARAILRDEF
jgi:hypothetical protein